MEKTEFIDQAPLYYALAIAAELAARGTISQHAIEQAFTLNVEGEDTCLVGLFPVWEAAINWLKMKDMITELKGAFWSTFVC
jgi:hypothetical protein